jgi:16S rRNA (adenine1518-N6/adenine1519-N6)-dimethyltransferase
LPGPRRLPIAKAEAIAAGFWTKKRLGQHLLRDPSVLELTLKALRPEELDWLLEIGPGLGALTEGLLRSGKPVVAVEIDPKACAALKERFAGQAHFELIQADIMELDFAAFLKGREGRFGIGANLPYYITTPLLARLLEEGLPFVRMLALTQWEVGERLAAAPGTKNYAAISVLMQYWCRVEVLRKVGPGAFTPPPKVDSALLLLERLEKPRVTVKDPRQFFRIVRSCFGKRRKTMKNGLRMSRDPGLEDLDWDHLLTAAAIDPSRRPETLSLEDFARLSNCVET